MANGYLLARAYVEVVPSLKGVGRAIVGAFDKAASTEQSVGRSMGHNIGAGLKGATGDVSRAMKSLAEPVRQVSRDMSHMPKGEAMRSMASAARGVSTAFKDTSLSVGESESKIHALRAAVAQAGTAVKQSGRDQQSAMRAVRTAVGDVQRAVRTYGSDSVQARSAVSRLSAAQEQYANVSHRASQAASSLRNAQSRLSDATSGVRGHIAAAKDSISQFGARLRETGSRFGSFVSRLRLAGRAGQSFGQRVKASTIAVGSAIGNMVSNAVSGFGDFARSCISTYNQASQGIARFNLVARNNGWTAAQKAGLEGLAQSLSHVGVTSVATTRAGQAMLGQMRLSAGAVRTLTPVLDDMVVGLHGVHANAGDAQQAARMLGLAVNGSTNALRRAGIVLTDSQKKTLAKMNADQRAGEMARLLEARFKGANAAMAATPAGKIQQLQNNFAALRATLGRSFLSTVGAVAPAISSMLTRAQGPVTRFAKWFTTTVQGIAHAVRTGNISGALKRAFGAVNAGPILQGIRGIRDGFSAAMKGLSGAASQGGRAMDGVKRHVSPLASLFQMFGSVARTLGQAVGGLAPHLHQLIGPLIAVGAAIKVFSTVAGIAGGPVGAVVTAVVALVAAFTTLELKTHFIEKAGHAIQQAWAHVSRFFSDTGKAVGKTFRNFGKDTQKKFSDAAKGAQRAWNNTGKWFQKTGRNIGNAFRNVGKNTAKNFRTAEKGARKIWNSTPAWFRNSIVGKIIKAYATMPARLVRFFQHPARSAKQIWRAVSSFFHSLPGRIAGFFGSIPGKIGGFFRRAGHTVQSIWRGVSSFFASLPGRIGGFFQSIPGRIGGLFRSAGHFAQNVWQGVVGFFRSIPGRIVSFFRSIPGRLVSIGGQMISGIISGIQSNIGRVAQVITGGMKSAIDHVKSFLGIHSPSTVMRDEIGQWIGRGMAVGIKNSMPAVSDAMGALADIPANTKLRPLDTSLLAANMPDGVNVPVYAGMSPVYMRPSQPQQVHPTVTQKVNVYTDHDDLYSVAPILYRATRNEVA